jgi:hypothetical protein
MSHHTTFADPTATIILADTFNAQDAKCATTMAREQVMVLSRIHMWLCDGVLVGPVGASSGLGHNCGVNLIGSSEISHPDYLGLLACSPEPRSWGHSHSPVPRPRPRQCGEISMETHPAKHISWHFSCQGPGDKCHQFARPSITLDTFRYGVTRRKQQNKWPAASDRH